MDNSDRFTKMAERISHNSDATFGGAAVIVPPANAGAPIELLILDSNADPAQFWGSILSRAQMEVQKVQDIVQMQRATGFAHQR